MEEIKKIGILARIKNLAEGWKIFFGLIGMVSVISYTAVKIDHIKNKKVNYEVRIDRWIKYDSIQHNDSKTFQETITTSLKDIKDTVRATNKGLRHNAAIMNNLQNYMENKVATKDGLKEVQSIFDVEKKNMNLFDEVQIPYNGNPTLILTSMQNQ